jgi:hypothetical protein
LITHASGRGLQRSHRRQPLDFNTPFVRACSGGLLRKAVQIDASFADLGLGYTDAAVPVRSAVEITGGV